MPITSRKGFKLNVLNYRAGSKRPAAAIVDANPAYVEAGVSRGRDNVSVQDDSQCTESNEKAPPASATYHENKVDEVEAWHTVENELISVKMALEVPVSSTCDLCGCDTDTPIRCGDCGSFVIYCDSCERRVHASVFHSPEIWKVSVHIIVQLIISS
jgi:hypothetical protein